jgi:hypothetical protein
MDKPDRRTLLHDTATGRLPRCGLIRTLRLGDTGLVAEFCTCGAQLPPDALFCHKCGKPQREQLAAAPEEEPVTAPEPEPASAEAARYAPPEIGLRNGLAIRVGVLAGSLAFVASSLPLHPGIRMLFLLGAGAFAVYLYTRRSGYPMEVRNGVKMGWIAGLFCFVIFTVLFTISFAAMAYLVRDGGMTAYMEQQLTNMGMSAENIKQAMDLFRNPVQILLMLVWLFFTLTFIPALGGALGARFLQRR